MRHGRILATAAMTAWFLLSQTALAEGVEWPKWRGPTGDGVTTETDWNRQALDTPVVLWSASVGKGYSSFAVVNDRVYTMGNVSHRDFIWCLDAESGDQIWSYTYACETGSYPGPRATPTVVGDLVYTVSRAGHVICLHADTGAVVWDTNIVERYGAGLPTWGLAGSACIEGDLLILNVGHAGMALDRHTGERKWSTGREAGGYATPVPFTSGGVRYVAILGRRALSGVEPTTGRIAWSYPWVTATDVNAADPMIIGDRIFISSAYGKGCAMIRITDSGPEELWHNTNMQNHFASSVYYNGLIYGMDGDVRRRDGGLVCLNPEDGEVVWRRKMSTGSVSVAGGTLVIMDDSGLISFAAASDTGFELYSRTTVLVRLTWTPPVLSGGRLYCRNLNGSVVCLDLRE